MSKKIQANRPFVVQSHRGAGHMSTDNTREAFELGWSLGTIPEADVRTTSDGVLVAFHDNTLARVIAEARTDPALAAKSVADITWAELSRMDAGKWKGPGFSGHRVPRLDEIFSQMSGNPGRELYLDFKDTSPETLARAVKSAGASHQVILASSDYALLRRWRELCGEGARTLYWMGTWGDPDETPLKNRFREMRDRGFESITQVQVHASLRLPLDKITRDSVDPFTPSDAFFREAAAELRGHGILFQSLPWGGASEAVYLKLMDLGVESFATDHPDVTLRAMKTWAPPEPAEPAFSSPGPMSPDEALAKADETQALVIGEDVLAQAPALFVERFGARTPAIVIADPHTFGAAGRTVDAALRSAGMRCMTAFVFDNDVYANYDYVDKLKAALRTADHAAEARVVPVAVGSGTINDLTKLASRLCERPYMAVATAASMDGYTAFGSSITRDGLKQTFSCPAPRAVLADVAVIAKAPPFLGAAGYADLLAKITAGADWLVADALGVEPMDGPAWRIVQGGLRNALANPAGIAAGDHEAVRQLTEGLMLGGFAMQSVKNSRPASGAEHQFSHLWDMQHHEYEGTTPSHGFKVGIATLAITALYEWLLDHWNPAQLDIDACCAAWPESAEAAAEAGGAPDARWWNNELTILAGTELAAKWISPEALRAQLQRLLEVWPELRVKLRGQLLSFTGIRRRLREAGAPHEPEQIGITRERLRVAFVQAQTIRRRFTVLDLALRTRTLMPALEYLFGPDGCWPASSTAPRSEAVSV
ncbi:glycerol dehydrogenase-like oxidoreductase [Opitutaceae bacterium TAV1]|nr:glycerol dehydrogenase-like oxidoreductase [Opitutaceae bacterium TAV1]